MLHNQKYRLDRWKRPESKSCCTILSKLVSKMFEIQLFDVVYFLLSNLYFYTYFHLSPLLDHHFLVFEEGRLLNISAEKLVVPKSEKANITCDMRFFPCCVAIFWLRKYIRIPHSLPKNVGVWTRSHIKKKCFLSFQYFHTILQQKYWSFKYSISIQSNDSIYSQDCRVVQWLVGRWVADNWNSVALLYDYEKRNRCPRLYHLPFNGAKSCPKSFFYNRAFSLRILKEFRLTKVSLLNYQERGFINS